MTRWSLFLQTLSLLHHFLGLYSLDSGVVAEVLAPTEDGEWILVKYIEAPESPDLVGTEDLCSTEEIVSLVS